MSTESYRYFAYKDGDYWRVQELLTVQQILSMLSGLNGKYPVFASIQHYNADGIITGAPVWLDFDGPPDTVLADTRAFVASCEFNLGVTPRIYFSGNKGFHLIIERLIEHVRVHDLVADFVKELAPANATTIDKRVYRARSMFRIPGSPASKPGFYKIELTRQELYLPFESIRQLATTPRMIPNQHDVSKLDEHAFDAWLAIAIAKLKPYDSLEQLKEITTSLSLEMTPCITNMLTKVPLEGARNATVYALARFLRICDFDEPSSLAFITRQPHFAAYEAEGREVSKVVRSVFHQRDRSMLGCRGDTIGAQLMRSHCEAPCPFRADFNHSPFG